MEPQPCDVLDIVDEDQLYRRITTIQMNPDGSVNSAAFKLRNGKPDPSISVEVARLTTIEECVGRPGRPGFGLASLMARCPRGLGLRVEHDPCPDEEPTNTAHALITGASTKQHLRDMAAEASLLIKPAPR